MVPYTSIRNNKTLKKELTVNGESHSLTQVFTDDVGGFTCVRPSISSAQTGNGQSSVLIGQLNLFPYCYLRAAIEPFERERGAIGGASKADCAVELNQLCLTWCYGNIGGWFWRSKSDTGVRNVPRPELVILIHI